jgi:hypothetical protein
MTKLISTLALTIALCSCSMFKKDDSVPVDNGGTHKELGEFKPGPYTDPATGKTCNAPGGYCESDKSCHSSASKCKAD